VLLNQLLITQKSHTPDYISRAYQVTY